MEYSDKTLSQEFLDNFKFKGNERYIYCTIEWKNGRYENNEEREDVIIKVSSENKISIFDDDDDDIFCYIDSIDILKTLSNPDTTTNDWFISDIQSIQ